MCKKTWSEKKNLMIKFKEIKGWFELRKGETLHLKAENDSGKWIKRDKNYHNLRKKERREKLKFAWSDESSHRWMRERKPKKRTLMKREKKRRRTIHDYFGGYVDTWATVFRD